MVSDNKIAEKVIDEEIKRRQKILEQMHTQIYKRVVELKLIPGEVVSKINRVDGVLVEFERKV